MNAEQFERLVAEALDGLPVEIEAYMDNVAVTIADWPTPMDLKRLGRRSPYELLGLYQGVPLTQRGRGYNLALPDRIIIFRGPIEALARTPEAIRDRVRRTVVHEIAHHFGLDDAELARLGF